MIRRTNFRSNFLEKISGCGGDFGELSTEAARKVLEDQILSETSDVDLGKLALFTIKHQIPANRRITIWKLLFGISSCYPEARQSIEKHRDEEVKLLMHSLQVMRKTMAGLLPDCLPSESDVVAMIQLADPSVSLSVVGNLNQNSIADKALLTIAKQIFSLCSGNWIDAYWLTLKFHEALVSVFEDSHHQKILDTVVSEVYAHLGKLDELLQQRNFDDQQFQQKRHFLSDQSNNESSSAPLHQNFTGVPACFYSLNEQHIRLWFLSGGASWLADEPLYRLWDKMVANPEACVILLKTSIINFLTYIYQQWCSSSTNVSGVVNEEPTLTTSDLSQLIKDHLSRDLQLKIVVQAIEVSKIRTKSYED